MSFILDALRKSEHERQRGAVPGISHVPFAAPRRDLPKWAFVVIGTLAVAVLALGTAWWNSSRGVAETPAAARAETPASSVASLPLEVPVERRELSPPARAADPSSLASAVTQAQPMTPSGRSALAPPASAAGQNSAARAPSVATPPETPRPAARDSGEPTLPSAAALAAEGVLVPDLRLELHAYSDRPSERFVFINGRKYVEGDRLPEGPQVVAIEAAGAVLLQQGRRFLLAPN